MCSLCKGYFVRKHFRKHVSICSAAEGNTHTPAGIQLEILSDNITFSEAFQKNILKDFWKDEIGNFVGVTHISKSLVTIFSELFRQI